MESLERFRTLFEVLEFGMLYSDADGIVREANQSAEEWLRVKRTSLLGRSLHQILPEPLADSLRAAQQQLTADPEQRWATLEAQLYERWCQIRLSPLRDSRGNLHAFAITLVDQTEKKQLQVRQKSLEQELAQSQKLSTIGFLASGIAHNLNGPLSVIMGYLDLLYCQLPDIQEIPLILAQAERMKEIISNMMVKSRQEQDHKMRWVDLNVLLQNELKFLEANLEFKNNVKKHFEFARNVPPLYGLYSDFSQVFLNLINNAVDAMYNAPHKNLRVATRRDDQNVYVEVEDTGLGFEMKDCEKLFTPFYTTKPMTGENGPGQPCGTGLGLSSALALVSKYGGDILVASQSGQGARFTVVLPLQRLADHSEGKFVESRKVEMECCS